LAHTDDSKVVRVTPSGQVEELFSGSFRLMVHAVTQQPGSERLWCLKEEEGRRELCELRFDSGAPVFLTVAEVRRSWLLGWDPQGQLLATCSYLEAPVDSYQIELWLPSPAP